jgi:superfamily I DNA/RNA helicase
VKGLLLYSSVPTWLSPPTKKTFATIHVSKVYVDEVQDYTQAEILLFFKLSGPGDLFLGGDPAQSVVEGVEF